MSPTTASPTATDRSPEAVTDPDGAVPAAGSGEAVTVVPRVGRPANGLAHGTPPSPVEMLPRTVAPTAMALVPDA
jgi:hypothetical protein